MDLIALDEQFEAFFDQWGNHGLWRFERELRAFSSQHDLDDALSADSPKEFHRKALALNRWVGNSRYFFQRLAQVREAGFRYLIFRTDGTCHQSIDGLILPASHPFWSPPEGATEVTCRCHFTGAHTMRAAIRRGGNESVCLGPDQPKFAPIDTLGCARPLTLCMCLARFRSGGHLALFSDHDGGEQAEKRV